MNQMQPSELIMGRQEILSGSCKTETSPRSRCAIRSPKRCPPWPGASKAVAGPAISNRCRSRRSCEVIDLIEQVQRILFPGFFSPVILRPENLEYHLGQQLSLFYENLASQISSAIRHDCFRHNLACTLCSERSYETAAALIDSLPAIRNCWRPTSRPP
jgi:serine O-acetyltransferase